MSESPLFNYLDIVTHNDRHKMSTPIESLLLDDFDAVIDDHTSDVFGNYLVIETAIQISFIALRTQFDQLV